MKKHLVSFGSFILYVLIAYYMDTVVFDLNQASDWPVGGNLYTSGHFATLVFSFIFSFMTLAYFWHGFNMKENAIVSNIVIILICLIAVFSVSFINTDLLNNFPFKFFFRSIGRTGLEFQFFAYQFSLALSLYNLFRFNKHKLPFFSKSTKD